MNTNRLGAAAGAIMLLVTGVQPGTAQASLESLGLPSLSLSGSYLAGRFAGKQGDNDMAAQFYAHALEGDPDNPVLIERAFILDLAAGNISQAEHYAERVLEYNDQHRMSRIVLGLKFMRDGTFAKARKHFESAAFTPVGELTSGLLVAWTHAADNNFDAAMKALDVLDRNDAFANFKLYHASLIADFLNKKDKAAKLYAQTYEAVGTSLRVVQSYGNFLARQGKRDEARKVYDKFLEANPMSPLVYTAHQELDGDGKPKPFIALAQDGSAEAMFSLASALTNEQNSNVALIYTQLSLSERPEFPVAQLLLGEIYEDMKSYADAVAAFEAIPLSSSLRSGAELKIANNLDNLKRTEEAIARLDKLIAREPENYDAHVTKGNLERGREKWLAAAESYTKALGLSEKVENRHWSVLYFRGISYERAKQWQKAEPDFLKALELRPDQPQVLNYLGYTWIEKRINLKKAMAMVRKAVDLRPNDGYIVDSLGWAHYQLGQYDEAVKFLERAVGLKPEDPVINDHLGDAYWKVGRKLEAGFQWRHAVDNKPEPDDLERIKRKLEFGLEEEKLPAPSAQGEDPDKS